MSSRTFCWAWDIPFMDTRSRLVLLYAAEAANMDGTFRPDIEQVATWAGLSCADVAEALEDLERCYLLVRHNDEWLLPEEVANEL